MAQLNRLLTASSLFLSAALIACAPASANVSLGLDDDTPPYYCTDSSEWVSRDFRPRDCNTVVSHFFHDETIQWGEIPFEFISLGADRRSDLKPLYIPHKYTWGASVPASRCRSFD